ncbi:MAG: SGNH/GDSL hydrolase family protein [Planctomycetales bacterium]|nr:SGNH/GDSL hydrolase family protein [Planctomycetales bacterium]
MNRHHIPFPPLAGSLLTACLLLASACLAQEGVPENAQGSVQESAPDASRWTYSPELLRPFWADDIVRSESVLFLRESEDAPASGSVLFRIREVISLKNAAGDITYQLGSDYRFTNGSREIIIPADSRIATSLPAELRRPDGSQPHRLTHRDGEGEIMFGAQLEYHQLQTMVTYRKASDEWPVAMPTFNRRALPRTLQKLQSGEGEALSIVLLGDSISTGCNASGWAQGAPYQPPYQELLREHLQEHYQCAVRLANLSVGGTATPWGITKIESVVEQQPDLVILAFGMNDSAGRTAQEYGQNTATMIAGIQEQLPQTEFILIAPMLGNQDWIHLNHDVFPEYRQALSTLCRPGIALADLTSVWEEFLRRKKDSDLTGNGVNHPNDFGHRVYAQVLSALLIEPR